MIVFKCKMCGGNLNANEGQLVCECEYCGTNQTLPRISDQRKANLFDRAGHFRRNNEFDKAIGIYEQLLVEEPNDAEIYWSLFLCNYGVEYVVDPATKKRIPTVNRTQFTSVLSDPNYLEAVRLADPLQRAVYEEEARTLCEIQKGILAISQNEEPFDVFICYKETDENGRRTPDSVYAQEIYKFLTDEGYRVFFSRITLEDKLGSAYEPYIFAALSSAKIMLAVGTRPEHFSAVWVKNEWSRFLSQIKNGEKKTIIPVYKDMDPYDLPDEFAYIQSQDMSKIGFMQDLLRGIGKILPKTSEKTATADPAVDSLIKRAYIFLSDGEFDKADEYAEKVLDLDPELSEAYLIKLLVDLRLSEKRLLAEQEDIFVDNINFVKAARYGDEAMQKELWGFVDTVANRIQLSREAYERQQAELREEQLRKKAEAEKRRKEILEERQLKLEAERLAEEKRQEEAALRREQEIEAIWKEYPDVKEHLKKEIELLEVRLSKSSRLSSIAAVLGVVIIAFAVLFFMAAPVLFSVEDPFSYCIPAAVLGALFIFLGVVTKGDKREKIEEQIKTYEDYLNDPIANRHQFRSISRQIKFKTKK